ncbi:DUF3800 domain-containing protein [Streptomyces spinoverrucosus]|uniref:DUF3800 domain-containing protein n=1 Tax=Streptomyces spinoverrucosus TaxID=284043 RepID=UPI0018C3D162|nr:DUF3800 domain-containing protein [Streptomyces spinoverrucosus]MBG0850644.1 DUF3800 domain-containing protein [Streptomyces spinoverrucosus]
MTGHREGQQDGAADAADAPLEVGCDESGSDGENLTGGNTDVFAHASVRLPVTTAAAYVREIRDRIRSPAEEYKANHLLREKHRAVLEWLLAPAGPLHGHAHVHLTEKAFFVVDRAADLLLDDSDAAVSLFRGGRLAFGEERWRAFLAAANQLLRARNDGAPGAPVEAFFRTVDLLRRADSTVDAVTVVDRLAGARTRAEAYRARFLDGPALIPVLNPLLPAIVGTAAHWSAGGRSVALVHDEQNMLTPDRIAWIERAARDAGIGFAGMRLVDSRRDARVQLADFLAGISRKIASDELNGRGDPVLTALLRPYVGTGSVWGDERSWARLGPQTENTQGPAKINSSV